MDRNAPITSKDVFPKRSARWLTKQKNPKFLWSLQNAQHDTNNLAISRDVFGYSKLIFQFFVLYHFYASWKFLLWLGISAWDSLGDKFWSSDFFLFCFFFLEVQGIFLCFDFCPHSIIPVTWNPEYPLWAWVKLKRTLKFSRSPSQVNLYFSDWKLFGGEQWKNQTFLYRKMHLKLKIPGKFSGF